MDFKISIMYSKTDCRVGTLELIFGVVSHVFKNEITRIARMRRRARNTGGGRCSFTHSYLDSFDDLRPETNPTVCVIWLKKPFFMSLALSSFVTVTVSDRSSLSKFRLISSFIHIFVLWEGLNSDRYTSKSEVFFQVRTFIMLSNKKSCCDHCKGSEWRFRNDEALSIWINVKGPTRNN